MGRATGRAVAFLGWAQTASTVTPSIVLAWTEIVSRRSPSECRLSPRTSGHRKPVAALAEPPAHGNCVTTRPRSIAAENRGPRQSRSRSGRPLDPSPMPMLWSKCHACPHSTSGRRPVEERTDGCTSTARGLADRLRRSMPCLLGRLAGQLDPRWAGTSLGGARTHLAGLAVGRGRRRRSRGERRRAVRGLHSLASEPGGRPGGRQPASLDVFLHDRVTGTTTLVSRHGRLAGDHRRRGGLRLLQDQRRRPVRGLRQPATDLVAGQVDANGDRRRLPVSTG